MTPKHLSTLARQAAKCVGGKGSPAPQTGLLVELDSAGRARFTGSDYTTALTTWIEGFGEPVQSAVVDPSRLQEVLNTLPSGGCLVPRFSVRRTEGHEALCVELEGSAINLRIIAPAADFQTLPEATGAFCELSPEDLETLERVTASCGTSELPGVGNTCVHLLRREDVALIAATDGHRIAFCRRPLTWGGEPPATVAVPADALRALKSIKPTGEHPVLLVAGVAEREGTGAQRITFTNGCFTLTTTAGNGDRGAAIEKLLSNLKPYTATAGADAAELRAVLLRAGVVAKRAANRVDLEELPGGELAVAAECDLVVNLGHDAVMHEQASFSEVLESGASYAAKRLPVSVDFRYLRDCLPKAGSVILGFQGDLIGVVSDDDTESPLCWLVARMKTAAELNAEREAAKQPKAQTA